MKLTTESGIEHSLFNLQVEKDGSLGSPIDMYVAADRADYEALRLSQAMSGYRIALYKMGRFKAFYRNGAREKVFDFREYYSNLSEDEYRSTKIQDSKTAEWI